MQFKTLLLNMPPLMEIIALGTILIPSICPTIPPYSPLATLQILETKIKLLIELILVVETKESQKSRE